MSEIRIIQNGAQVLLLINGRQIEGMPHQIALKLGKALASVAKQAEEWAEAERIARDQALLMRAGVPFGLTEHPKILAEAKKQSEHDRALRRYLPGIPTQETFGAPRILQTPPRRKL